MVAIVGLFIILILSLTIVRIGTIALELTGLSRDIAAFQAQSAFSGTGFTTSESEGIVSHPVRRKIIRVLILVGNVGIISTGATLIVALISTNTGNLASRMYLLIAGLLALYLIARSQIVYRIMKHIITVVLTRIKALQLQDYHEILGLGKGHSISRIRVKEGNWLIDRKLKELGLLKEGSTILSIDRKTEGKQEHIIPYGDTVIQFGDLLTVYGRDEALNCLFMRSKGTRGDDAHRMRVKQMEILRAEKALVN